MRFDDGSVLVVKLSDTERADVDRGIFVRVDLPRQVTVADGGIAATALVGRVAGKILVYANICRHNAIPLDARGGTRLGVMTEDGRNLFCDSHGAVYRPQDGLCTQGPCEGTHLYAFDVRVVGDALRLSLPDPG